MTDIAISRASQLALITQAIPVALTLDDGSVAIMHYVVEGRFSPGAALAMIDTGLSFGARPETDGSRTVERATTDEAIALEVSRSGLAQRVTSWRRLGPNELPTDRRYRNSWRDNGEGKGIGLDLPKARAERLAQLREQRNAMLDQIDKAANTADDEGRAADARALRAKRPALRDMPALVATALERAQTADELEAVRIPD